MRSLLPFFYNHYTLHYLLYSILFAYITLTHAIPRAFTIDDTLGDSRTGALPVYNPVDSFSQNSNCADCTIRADLRRAFQGTWHDSSQFPNSPPVSVTLSFTGTTIDVFCIIANEIPGVTTTADYAILLDGVPQRPYSHSSDGTPNYQYGVNVFSARGLDQRPHRVVLSTNNPAGSLLLFDYASYTFDDGTTSPQSQPPPPPPPPPHNPPNAPPTKPDPPVTITTVIKGGTTTIITKGGGQLTGQGTSSTASGSGVFKFGGKSQSPVADQVTGTVGGVQTSSPVDTPSPSSPAGAAISASEKSNFSPALIAVPIIVALLALAACIFFICRCRRARSRAAADERRIHSPYPIPTPNTLEGNDVSSQTQSHLGAYFMRSQNDGPTRGETPAQHVQTLDPEKGGWGDRSASTLLVDESEPRSPPPRYSRRLPPIPASPV
ncbi:hypothetical protein C8J57DRAFT_428405 [Mycena rebaudengoi]|nr:hypothetical protein C8J57DRAFT_428405 [Mycena rebaudengoi]